MLDTQSSSCSSQSESQQSQSPPKFWKKTFKRKMPCTLTSVPASTTAKRLAIRETPTHLKTTETQEQMQRQIRKLKRQLAFTKSAGNDCPRGVDGQMRALTSAGAQTCTLCGLSHRKVELYKFGTTIYGDNYKESKTRWLQEGISEYLDRMQRACVTSEVAEQIREDLCHVETQMVGAKSAKNRTYQSTVVQPTIAAVRSQLENLVCLCLMTIHMRARHTLAFMCTCIQLYRMSPHKWNLPQFLYAFLCRSKHVPHGLFIVIVLVAMLSRSAYGCIFRDYHDSRSERRVHVGLWCKIYTGENEKG